MKEERNMKDKSWLDQAPDQEFVAGLRRMTNEILAQEFERRWGESPSRPPRALTDRIIEVSFSKLTLEMKAKGLTQAIEHVPPLADFVELTREVTNELLDFLTDNNKNIFGGNN